MKTEINSEDIQKLAPEHLRNSWSGLAGFWYAKYYFMKVDNEKLKEQLKARDEYIKELENNIIRKSV